MSRYAILHAIERLDPEKDHQRIIFLSTCYDFPFDTTRALEFALFRTFCVPSISALLDRTEEFSQRSQKRYDDTDIIVSELLEWGYDSERGKRALRRLNQLHGRFSIANEDFLYVLSTFIFEPIRWNERFGWRLLCEQERLGYFYFWREVGRRMNIRGTPADYDVFERFNKDYERQHYRFTEANRRVGEATRELFASWVPRFLAPVVRSAIYALLDDRLIGAFGFPQPSPLMRWLVPGALRLRAGCVRLLPPQRKPRLRTEMGHPTYPKGYVIEQLGPPGIN
jgi:ER-bound oxygenase mpaB/B'/Rubber oxygenase, catalytic domain